MQPASTGSASTGSVSRRPVSRGPVSRRPASTGTASTGQVSLSNRVNTQRSTSPIEGEGERKAFRLGRGFSLVDLAAAQVDEAILASG